MSETINVNIFDDYYGDDAVPAGEIQETYAYLEGTDLSDDDQRAVLLQLQLSCMELKKAGSSLECNLCWYDAAQRYPMLVGTEIEACLFKRWQLEMKNLPHSEREALVENLAGLALTYRERPLFIYSES